ncbi:MULTISPECIES: RNA polymerase sigma factor [Methylosinus]|nr:MULTISPECIES: sigma-70 family RNA polymerase sigma factor [Methylosinus]OBS53205.1 hypothetical protein A8B73_07905 [Methylosinus sp. 3S-1]
MRFSPAAIDQLYRRHNRALQGLARRQVGREDAEDVVQEAYLRLLELENANRIVDARGYLYRIAANVALDLLRKRKTRSACVVEDVEYEAVSGSDSPFTTAAEEAVLLRNLQASLAQLPSACCETFLLSRLYGMTFPEIARRLGISLRTVNRHMSRTVDHLQTALDGGAGRSAEAEPEARAARARSRPRAELRPSVA